jgi:hypothetical protein
VDGSGAWSLLYRRRSNASTARPGAVEQERALAAVAGRGRGAFELGACLVEPAELEEQDAADAGEEVIGLERFGRQGVDEREPGRGAVRAMDVGRRGNGVRSSSSIAGVQVAPSTNRTNPGRRVALRARRE